MAIPLIDRVTGAEERIDQARRKYENRWRRYEQAVRLYEDKHKDVASRFEELGKTRLEAMVTLGKAVKFLEQAKLWTKFRQRELFEKFNITTEHLARFKKASVNALEILEGGARALNAGVATAVAAYGLVGTLASAGTGTAISVLSGAAAKSATLAWLGGGTLAAGGGGVAVGTAVLGGLFVVPAILVLGFLGLKKAGDYENKVEEEIAKLDIDEAKKRAVVDALDAVLVRVAEVEMSTIRLKNEIEDLLSSVLSDHVGFFTYWWRYLFNRLYDEHEVYEVAKLSASLGQILDVAILDKKDGRII